MLAVGGNRHSTHSRANSSSNSSSVPWKPVRTAKRCRCLQEMAPHSIPGARARKMSCMIFARSCCACSTEDAARGFDWRTRSHLNGTPQIMHCMVPSWFCRRARQPRWKLCWQVLRVRQELTDRGLPQISHSSSSICGSHTHGSVAASSGTGACCSAASLACSNSSGGEPLAGAQGPAGGRECGCDVSVGKSVSAIEKGLCDGRGDSLRGIFSAGMQATGTALPMQ
mmetsp:Transcript_1033/g.3517  ORF Transcript_1033/g.3517 Transcript_1033/m.3517 type:complete len:226 (-) Transcript_1033:948-1625(-)